MGPCAVKGQRLRITSGQTLEMLDGAFGNVLAQNGQLLGQLQLCSSQETTPWVACPTLPIR